MAKLDDLKQMAQEQADKITNLNTALDGFREQFAAIKKQLDDLLAQGGIDQETQVKINEIAEAMGRTTKLIDDTYAENFPPPPAE